MARPMCGAAKKSRHPAANHCQGASRETRLTVTAGIVIALLRAILFVVIGRSPSVSGYLPHRALQEVLTLCRTAHVGFAADQGRKIAAGPRHAAAQPGHELAEKLGAEPRSAMQSPPTQPLIPLSSPASRMSDRQRLAAKYVPQAPNCGRSPRRPRQRCIYPKFASGPTIEVGATAVGLSLPAISRCSCRLPKEAASARSEAAMAV